MILIFELLGLTLDNLSILFFKKLSEHDSHSKNLQISLNCSVSYLITFHFRFFKKGLGHDSHSNKSFDMFELLSYSITFYFSCLSSFKDMIMI